MKRLPVLLAAAVFAACPALSYAELANIKVVTDANPDYSDMESMVRSITSNWKTDAGKMWALFYWDHIARRQTRPMHLHGNELTDPIRQFNDYGFTMCSTISGIKCSEYNYLGYPCRFFDISNHTVGDVWYDGRFHHYDNSLSMYYTLSDGKTIASVEDIGKTMAGPETNGQPVKGYIALYHAVTGTSANGYCEGSDDARPLEQITHDFDPRYLKYRSYYYNQDRGHRYILNLREHEVYTRFYSRQDANSPNAVLQDDAAAHAKFKADPAYFVPNVEEKSDDPGNDPEVTNARYHIRGNGDRTWSPALDDVHFLDNVSSAGNISPAGKVLQPIDPAQPAVAVFQVQGANVITSLKIRALTSTVANGAASIAISTNNGLAWKDVWKSDKPGENAADLKLIKEVNGYYEVLVKVTLNAVAQPQNAQLLSINFDAITEINAHTQPMLKLGKNTVYVGNGEQTESIVLWPDLQGAKYKEFATNAKNIRTADHAEGYLAVLAPEKFGEESYVVFKVDSPTDITSLNYGARMYNRDKSHIDYLHSFDGGQTWKKDYTDSDTKGPFDVIHYEVVNDVPPGTKSVLFKYAMTPGTRPGKEDATFFGQCGLYSVRMEVDHKLTASADPSNEPLEVTFNWQERQKDYSTVKRSHTQIVDKLPATYTIDVGGYDQPIVDSLTVNLKGARPDVKPGYSDGQDVGGEKFVGQWATYGKNLAEGKPYTLSLPSETQYGAGDPNCKKLTDGRVGSPETGGGSYKDSALWKNNANPEITVDLGEIQKCAAFRIHTLGYPFWDAIKGENKDKIEVLVSSDGKNYKSVGTFNPNLYWKDIPVNFMYFDDETFTAYNFFLPMDTPVDARYVKYKVTSERMFGCTEVQVLDSFKFEPFDLKIALPDPAQNGKPSPKADISANARKWAPDEPLPKSIGKAWKATEGSGDN